MRRLITLQLAAPLLVAVFTLQATALAAAPSQPKKVATVEGITEYRLDNGARILLLPDPSSPKITVNMTVLVGSRHEGYGESGMAHLLEHMLFKGTPNHPDIPGAMKARGARFNGTTNDDRTNYFETLSASDDNLEFAIALEADRLVNSRVSGDDLKTEFSVVRNEFEMGENSPQRVLNQRMMATAFEWHNYGKSTIGNRSDIERVPVDRLRAFYTKFYQPDNVVVVVAGKFDEASALALVNKHFGAIIRPERTLDATYTEEPAQDGERMVTLRRVGNTPALGLIFHAPAASHPDAAALAVLANILAADTSGRLYKALVEPKRATHVSAGCNALHDPGTFDVTAQLPKGGDVEAVYGVVLLAIEALKQNGVTTEEVDRAKRQLENFRERVASNVSGMAVLLSGPIAQGDWRLYFINRDRAQAVTPEEVRQAAVNYLTRTNRTVGFFMPAAQPERTSVPATPDIGRLVEGYKGRAAEGTAEAFDVAPLAIEARVRRPPMIEGVKVALLPKKTRGKKVVVSLTLHYGDAESLKGYEAAAPFLGKLMARATKKLNRQQVKDELDRHGASLYGMGGPGSLDFSVDTKRADLVPVLEVLRQVLREPALPADEFEVMRVQQISGLEGGKSDPNALAANRLARLTSAYPPGDVRYAPTLAESIDRLNSTTVEQVRTLYNDYLGASHGELTVVGDFEPSEVLPVFRRMLSGWKSGKAYARIERPYQDGVPTVRETIVTRDKANALFLAQLAMPLGDEHPDYPALVVGNFIFGGGAISSRLADRLRQKEGLSYGVTSEFIASPTDLRATLSVNAICNPKNLPKAVAASDDELARLVHDGVTGKELEAAKAGFVRQLESGRTSDAALARMLSRDLELGRTMQHEAALIEAVRRLQPDDVASALRKHVDPRKLVVVGAGDVPADAVK